MQGKTGSKGYGCVQAFAFSGRQTLCDHHQVGIGDEGLTHSRIPGQQKAPGDWAANRGLSMFIGTSHEHALHLIK